VLLFATDLAEICAVLFPVPIGDILPSLHLRPLRSAIYAINNNDSEQGALVIHVL
jgi:hypothetical protein